MSNSLQEFVAEDLWLLIGLVTFVLISLAGLAGFEGLAGAITIIGWFLLAPIFLFWGEEIATLLIDDEGRTEPARGGQTGSDPESETKPDAIDELKRRYAEGKIDDDEFEHRLERLVAVDDLPDEVFIDGASTETATADRNERTGRQYERER
ncbi:SHOCT domain-containing protein [Natronorubrum sp. JWXQ-INN-674]|uniref:SHOCT domain-containing protein n=1 Tax=Natronorubrum halalkaliphilum TaxID=2691917 RepID=A0A6B0VHS5_9EURY|nr:SHOCT domain-containing protein [Natronorubrum halalkaliphilum]MXV60637.1 SHOCT domain-containing protein [Natronorubrum halalkaliphilum]